MGSAIHAAGMVLFHFMVTLVGVDLAPNAEQQLCHGCNVPLVELNQTVTVCVCTPCERPCTLPARMPVCRTYWRRSPAQLHACLSSLHACLVPAACLSP